MKVTIIVAIALMALGVVGLAYGGISYWSRETIVDLGPIQASADKKQTIPIPPIAGGVLLAAGAALLLFSRAGRPETA